MFLFFSTLQSQQGLLVVSQQWGHPHLLRKSTLIFRKAFTLNWNPPLHNFYIIFLFVSSIICKTKLLFKWMTFKLLHIVLSVFLKLFPKYWVFSSSSLIIMIFLTLEIPELSKITLFLWPVQNLEDCIWFYVYLTISPVSSCISLWRQEEGVHDNHLCLFVWDII